MRLKTDKAQPTTRKKFRQNKFTRVSEPKFGFASKQEAHDSQHTPSPEEVIPESWPRRFVKSFSRFMRGE